MDFSKNTQLKKAFINNVFNLFTDSCGGNPVEFADILYNKYTVEVFDYGDFTYYHGIKKYFQEVVIPHKIAVYNAGMELLQHPKIAEHLGTQEQEHFKRNLWLHDMSKFSTNEAFGYAMYNRTTGHGKEDFERAWHHHKMNNPHHPEYWLNPNRSGELEPIPMENIYIVEMIADWIGAGKTYGSTLEAWLPQNISKFKFTHLSKVQEMIRDFTGINVVQQDYKLIVE